MPSHIAILLASVPAALLAAAAQNPADRFKASTTAVVVDVVVHDKQRHPVRGLSADDFEVWEDGKRQQINSFIAVDTTDDLARTTEGGAAVPRVPSLRHADDPPAVAALVFHELGPEARYLAMKAASRFIEESVGPGGFAGIFSQDFALHVVTPFTNDPDVLSKGLRTASTKAEPTRDPLTMTPVMECTQDTGALPVFDGLNAIVASLGHLPGRKTLILFSEGINTRSWLCDNRHDQFLHLAGDANRAHVAFYTFDAAGLRIQSTVGAADGAPYVALTKMAQETGGAFVESTNDLTPSMRGIAGDLRQYYLLSYTPAKPADDKYRTIDVKVKREGLTILARKGYRASRDAGPAVVRPAEVPALLLLDEPTHEDAIPLLVTTLRVPEPGASGRTAILARVPLDGVTFGSSTSSARPTGRLTVLARVENQKQEVVHYAAETYDLTTQPGQMDASGSILFFTEAALPRTQLSVAVAAFDALGQKGSVRTETLKAPAEAAGDLSVGDLVVATQIRPKQGATPNGTAPGIPFGDVVLVPNMGEPVPGGPPLVVAFQAVADRRRGALSGSLDLKRNGAVVTSLPLQLPEPKDDGLVRFATRFPTDKLDAGSYVLMLTVKQGKASVEREAALTIGGAAGAGR